MDDKTATRSTYAAAEGNEPATFTVGNTPGVALPATGGRGSSTATRSGPTA